MIASKRSLRTEQVAGSPPSGEPAFVVIGKLRRPHGLRGEILMEVLTDFPDRLHEEKIVYIGAQYLQLRIRGFRWHGDALLISFHDYHDRDKVGILRNQLIYVPVRDIPQLPEGDFYHHQVIGLQVIDDTGTPIGYVTEIIETGANDVLIVHSKSGRELLIPVIDSVIINIDLDSGKLQIHPIPGLNPKENDLSIT